jgi:hypothetical protein
MSASTVAAGLTVFGGPWDYDEEPGVRAPGEGATRGRCRSSWSPTGRATSPAMTRGSRACPKVRVWDSPLATHVHHRVVAG